MNNKQVNRNSANKNNMQKKSNLKPLIYTFLGTFIVFFFAFTVLLPILTPQVDIPALSDEHSMSSITSNDFKGRIDPRLSSIKAEENAEPPRLKMEVPKKEQMVQEKQQQEEELTSEQPQDGETAIEEPQDDMMSDEETPNYNMNVKSSDNTQKPRQTSVQMPKTSTSTKTIKPSAVANIPPRPQQLPQQTAKPSTAAKVILGSYATPMQARLVSDTLIEMDLNVSPFIKERNGRYVLQVGSFSDSSKAQGLVDDLRSKGFDAKAVNE